MSAKQVKVACLGVLSTVFNGNSSQIHVSWTIFLPVLNQSIIWHWGASRSAIPIILSVKKKTTATSFIDFGLLQMGIEPMTSCSQGRHSNP